MNNVKKAYVEIVELLELNKNKKISTILPQILEMVSAKTASKTFSLDDEGNVVAIYCYYHKCWELVSEVEFGAKASTATGLNTMCKVGVSAWSKQQRDAKKAKEELLASVASGEVEPSELTVKLSEIEATRSTIVLQEEGFGFATLEEALNFADS
tara:strand:+ start:144 stop:608 length:465 start_codon:yes stop_codon:yes gene_type:complete